MEIGSRVGTQEKSNNQHARLVSQTKIDRIRRVLHEGKGGWRKGERVQRSEDAWKRAMKWHQLEKHPGAPNQSSIEDPVNLPKYLQLFCTKILYSSTLK